MTLTEKSLRQWTESARICPTAQQRTAILDRFGTEPGDGKIWTEQDIAEQIREICRAH
jgi:hypothetical protein